MALYTTTPVSGYNASPPPDDDTHSDANKVKWSTLKGKLGDPLNTFAATLDAKLLAAFAVLDLVAPKALLKCGTSADILYSYNIASLVDTRVGGVAVTFTVPFASANYVIVATALTNTGSRQVCIDSQLAGSFSGYCTNNGDTPFDPVAWMFACFGDQ